MVSQEHNKKRAYSSIEKAILTTILYSDIFHFPLKKSELWKYLISNKEVTKEIFEKTLQSMLRIHIISQDQFYCLRGNEDIISKRKNNRDIFKQKLMLAQNAAAYLSKIPSVLFIGLTGALAAENATDNDDIDFFIITRDGTLYATRFLIALFLEYKGIRRKRKVKHAQNKICVNLLIDESALRWTKQNQNLYTAREIAQIVPLFARNNIYNKFLEENDWVLSFLPNAFLGVERTNTIKDRKSFISKLLRRSHYEKLEKIIMILQKRYMNMHKTTEIVTEHQLAFHPIDYKTQTLTQLKLKMRLFGLLTIH